MHILELYRKIGREELDSLRLFGALKKYKQPRMKVRSWLASGDLIRIKQGFYVFGDHVRKGNYSYNLLSNWIYGPSAVSFLSALSLHGLIPERVYETTAICLNRSKAFTTPIGIFSYQHIPTPCMALGLQIYEEAINTKALIASPEKALVDLLTFKTPKLQSEENLRFYLEEDLRIDIEDLRQLDRSLICDLASLYQSPNTTLLSKWSFS